MRFAASGASENIKKDLGETGFLYSVRVKDGADVIVKLGHDQYIKHEHEVVAHDGILKEDVLGAVEIDEFGQPVGESIPNSGYKND